jgi:hypothetical protein
MRVKGHTPRDRDGRRLKPGDVVRIIGVPDLSKMNPDARADMEPVFAQLVGQYKRITAFEWEEARLDFPHLARTSPRVPRGLDRAVSPEAPGSAQPTRPQTA